MTTSKPFDTGPLVDVDCHASGDRWTLTFIRELQHAPDEVWRALTDPAHLREWSPYTADRDLGTPGEATLTMIDGEARQDLSAEILRAERPTLLEYSWGGDHMRWELAPMAGGTRLTLRHTLADRDWAAKVAAGWHICLAVADRLLAGDPVGPIVGENARNYGWDDLSDAYAKRLGTG